MNDQSNKYDPKALDNYNGAILSERYELTELLGSGSMGSVYKAYDKLAEAVCAVKITHPDVDPNANILARFRREFEIANRLSHPNIVKACDIGELNDGAWFIVMEYVPGKTLELILENLKGTGLPIEKALKYFTELMLGLQEAHKYGIIHRDIKPSNIMITEFDTLKITDFGVAKPMLTTEQLTVKGDYMGTLLYISPEQTRDQELDSRADIYSAGIMFYEMLTGSLPFYALAPAALVQMKQALPFPSVRAKRPDCPKWLENIVLKCTERDPELRYSSVETILRDLKNQGSIVKKLLSLFSFCS